MPKIKVNTGITIYYEQYGQGDDLVLIAGLSADHNNWALVLDALSKKFRVLIFDNRGSGQTDTPKGPYAIEMMMADMLALMDGLSIRKATIVGHSLGGLILQHMCLQHPDRVNGAILCASTARLPIPSVMQIASVIKMREQNIDLRLIFESVLPWLYADDFLQDTERVEQTLQLMLNNPYPQTLEGLKAQFDSRKSVDLLSQIGKITTKTLVLAGQDDLLTPIKCSEELHRLIPKSRLKIVEQCGHMIPLEKPELFCETVLSFL